MRRCVPVCSSVCVCQWGGGRWGCRCGCLSVLEDPAGDCSQIQLIPTGCFHLSSTSDEGGKKRKEKGESPEVQYLVCINLCPIPQETLVIISIPPSVRRTGSSAAFLWHVGLDNEKDKPWSLQTPPRGGDSRDCKKGWRHIGNGVWGVFEASLCMPVSHPQGLEWLDFPNMQMCEVTGGCYGLPCQLWQRSALHIAWWTFCRRCDE